ncbi:MAG: immunoglobulin domain-containing protein [Verrucomicrobiota bacterium]
MNSRSRRLGGLLVAVMTCGYGLMAAPVVVTHPRNQAVFLGDAATFHVEASGVPPLTYQWRRDGDDLESATQPTLSLPAVTLKELGDHVVVVRDAKGEAVSRPASLLLARWTELAVFDSSISLASASSGDSWVESFADRMGLNKGGQVLNFAASGSHGPDVAKQTQDYLKNHSPGTNSLLAPWWAGMTAELALNRSPVDAAVSNDVANLTLLLEAGARSFILPTLPPSISFLGSATTIRGTSTTRPSTPGWNMRSTRCGPGTASPCTAMTAPIFWNTSGAIRPGMGSPISWTPPTCIVLLAIRNSSCGGMGSIRRLHSIVSSPG